MAKKKLVLKRKKPTVDNATRKKQMDEVFNRLTGSDSQTALAVDEPEAETYLVYTQRQDTKEPAQWYQAFGPDKKPIVLVMDKTAAIAIVERMASATALTWRLVHLIQEW
jgi:hypothetical protein